MYTVKHDKKGYFQRIDEAFSTHRLLLISMIISMVLLVVEHYDLLDKMETVIPPNLFFASVTLIVFSVLISLFRFKVLQWFVLPVVNTIDAIVLVANICSVLFTIFSLENKIVGYFCATITLVCLIWRMFRCMWALKKRLILSEGIYDLKDIYDNNFRHTGKRAILLEEDDVMYDLLGRDITINQVQSAIETGGRNRSFVVGVEGEWGSGKTTIINSVKAQICNNDVDHKYIIIDEIDPWIHDSPEALLTAIYSAILNQIGMKYSMFDKRQILEELCVSVGEKYGAGGVTRSAFKMLKNQAEQVGRLKENICNYLEVTGKKIVFFIDNIDRASAANIIFLFKLIRVIFDLPKVVYVLAYDKERMNDVLKKTFEIDEHYIEKIVQQEIKVPQIAKEVKERVYFTCMHNILSAYGIQAADYGTIMKLIVSRVDNVRQFKRLINSAFSTMSLDDACICKKDLLTIEVIKFIEPLLYKEIYEHRWFFISHNQMADIEATYSKSFTENFEKKRKVFYDSLFDKYDRYDRYIDVLADMFPYVAIYKSNPNSTNYRTDILENQQLAREMRICSARYFEFYFSLGKNVHINIWEDVVTFINDTNEEDTYSTILRLVVHKLETLPREHQGEWLEVLLNNLDNLQSRSCYFLSKAVYTNIYDLSSIHDFLMPSPRIRAILLLVQLLKRCNEEEQIQFVDDCQTDYSKVEIIRQIIHLYNVHNDDGAEEQDACVLQLTKMYETMCNKILTDKINLYSDTNYKERNIWGLYWYCQDRKMPFNDYIKFVVCENNVYRVLWDVVGVKLGTKYRYYIKHEEYNEMFDNDIDIDRFMQEILPRTEHEQFVYEVYQAFTNGTEDAWGQKGVSRDEAINMQL